MELTMKINFLQKRYFVLLFIFLISFVYYSAQNYHQKNISEYLQKRTDSIQLSYNAIYAKHKDIADIVFKTEINKPEILELFKNRERVKLQEKLFTDYKELRHFSVRQLHFHLPNNDSFLRMHRPKKFGDNLSKARLTVKYVNEHLKPIDGFEEGKIFNGFRFVYPLFDGQKHIGSVEISFSALAFIKDIMNYYKLISNFHISKKVVGEKVFKEEQSNYIQSPLSKYYCQKSIVKYTGIDLKNRVLTSLQLNKIQAKIQEVKAFSVYDPQSQNIVTFMPIINSISKEVVSVFTFRDKAFYVASEERNLQIILFISCLIIAIGLILLYKELTYKHKLEDDIANNTKDIQASISLLSNVIKGANLGYWDWYPQTKEHIVNDRWLEILGLSREDISNTDSDWSQRVYPEDLKKISPIIKDAIEKNKPYSIRLLLKLLTLNSPLQQYL